MRRVVYAVFAALMGVSALVQLNDPDPMLWVAAYGAAALVFAAAALGTAHRWLTISTFVILALLAARSAPGFVEWLTQHRSESIVGEMSVARPYIEETREFLGLALAMLGLLGLLAWPPSADEEGSSATR
ncbi:MAG: transmembrane 220 family protein [Acidobacteriota bacterium]